MCALGVGGTAAASRQRIGNPVDDIEEQERCWKTLARDLVDTTRSSLASFDIHCYGVLPSISTAATVEPLRQTGIDAR